MSPSRTSEVVRITAPAGITLTAERFGTVSSEPPVLLLHGGGQTRHSWGGTAQRLAERGFEAWTLDLRGHGDSDWAPDGDYTTDAMVEDLDAVCERIGRPPVVVTVVTDPSLGSWTCSPPSAVPVHTRPSSPTRTSSAPCPGTGTTVSGSGIAPA